MRAGGSPFAQFTLHNVRHMKNSGGETIHTFGKSLCIRPISEQQKGSEVSPATDRAENGSESLRQHGDRC